MSLFVRVKPREGLRVRDADGRFVPPAGVRVERGMYIERRIRAGELIVIDAGDAALMPAPAKKGK